jgi:hypothetical protein
MGRLWGMSEFSWRARGRRRKRKQNGGRGLAEVRERGFHALDAAATRAWYRTPTTGSA